MVTRQISYVDIQERDDFDDLLHGLPRYAQTTLAVDVGADVDVLATAAEFEDLFEAAQKHAVRIELVTDDPVRQEFARIYGMRRVLTVLADTIEIELSSAASADAPTMRSKTLLPDELDVTEEFSIDRQPDSFARPSTESAAIFDSEASFSFVTAPASVPAPGIKRMRHRSDVASRPRTVSKTLGSGSIVVSAVAVAVAISVLLVSLLAPTASVIIVPESRSVQAEVTYGLAGSAAGLDVFVEPMTISETIVFESSIPASGETFVPDSPARGMIFLTNPYSEVIDIPAGTIFSLAGGDLTFVSLEAIEIPAADPFGSARFGTAAIGIEATEAGPSGNLEVGELSGTLESGIMFQNRFPLEGGDLKSVAVVTADDIDALKAGAVQEIESRTGSVLNEQIPEGWSLVSTPEINNQISTEISAVAGAITDTVSIKAQALVSADIYDPAALESEARAQLLGTLSTAVPEGFGLVVDSVKLSMPQAIADGGSRVFSLSAEGTVEAQFDPALAQQLSSDLVGKSEKNAIETIQRVEGVDSFSVNYGPDWLPWNPVPRFSNRISVEINGT